MLNSLAPIWCYVGVVACVWDSFILLIFKKAKEMDIPNSYAKAIVADMKAEIKKQLKRKIKMGKPKFRAWDNFYKMMLHSSFNDFSVLSEFFKELEDRHEHDCKLMKFTGLKDKNGKDIYEGDIVKLHYFYEALGSGLGVCEAEKEIVGEIATQELGIWIQCEKEEDCGYLLWINGMHEESLEVIGNIYENSELLSAENSKKYRI